MCITIAANIAETAILTYPACFPDSVVGFIADATRADVRFVEYAFRLLKCRLQQEAMGSVQDNINLEVLSRLRLPVPKLDEQAAIADVLGALDDKIEQNRRTGAKLEELARAVFKAWFVDFEPVKAKAAGTTAFPGMPPETFAALHTRFEDSELGPLPQGWTCTDLGSEFELQVGYAFKSAHFTDDADAVRLVRGDNVKEGWIEWGSKTRSWKDLNEKVMGYNLAVGDVVMGMDGSKLGKNWARIRKSDLPCLLVQRVARFRANRAAGPSLLWLLVSHPTFREFIDAVKTGTSIPHISGGQLRSFKFVKPEIDSGLVWSAFEYAIAPLLNMADHLVVESAKLATLRDYLLPRLLSARIRVARSDNLLDDAERSGAFKFEGQAFLS